MTENEPKLVKLQYMLFKNGSDEQLKHEIKRQKWTQIRFKLLKNSRTDQQKKFKSNKKVKMHLNKQKINK